VKTFLVQIDPASWIYGPTVILALAAVHSQAGVLDLQE
jgi:hypothetical protein